MQALVDMTLMCSSHTLRVHKAVLAASSAYFQEVLQKQAGEPLIILKMRFSVLKCLVEFMYCGKTQCLEENLDELVSAAQFLKIKGLSKVTKEGLGIANNSEMPIFTPPVVINRPPQSLIDLHSQDSDNKAPQSSQLSPVTSTSQPVDSRMGNNKDMVVRIPFDIENGGSTPAVDYSDVPRAIKPRRGRPSVRRSGAWEGGTGALGRAAERALLRREQDSRKAIHQLKHLQTRHMQDYMDRVTLSQAVNSICGPESSANYMNIDNDLMYMDQTDSSNVLDPTIAYNKEHSIGNETITSYSNTNPISSVDSSTGGISTAMSQYVNALKSAGLPTDLPILFESGDGSYINVNEQVLLDMVQSSEIQYEVIEQPNIIEKVADPSEIKSIDDLSKSIERGEMLLGGNKGYSSNSDYDKDSSQYNRTEDAINSLNAILPDNLESFEEQQNYVVLDPRLQENNNSMDHENAHDFSCIDGDMQFFTKSMSDDVKKYYEDQQLHDSRVIEQLCPTSTSLDTNFNISLLDTKSSHLSSNLSQQYNSLNPEDLRRNEDCYDFGLQLPQSAVFKEDALDCLMATPKRTVDDEPNNYEDSTQLDQRAQERDEIIKDLMNIENKMNMAQQHNSAGNDDQDNLNSNPDCSVSNYNVNPLNDSSVFDNDSDNMNIKEELEASKNNNTDLSATLNSGELQWGNLDMNIKVSGEHDADESNKQPTTNESQIDDAIESESQFGPSVIDLTSSVNHKTDQWEDIMNEADDQNKENEETGTNVDGINSSIENDIPYAVGLLPLKQVPPMEEGSLLKRKNSIGVDLLDNVDAQCLKRKVKYKKL
ncbi:hypothetical protein PYW07_001519 [Mythimna separata]|uniref:BTB domain-containing protein n=1 Tax=Mythimna separata TaxID=271217 RepID=A0AAD8DVY4_MYTSE|nr:hypothetical protein PYW07_001519 [Mythimna separata]